MTRRRSTSALPGPAATLAGLPATARLVQVTPLEARGGLDDALAAAGWTASGATDVLVATAAAVAAAAEDAPLPDDLGFHLDPDGSPQWRNTWGEAEARTPADVAAHHAAILRRIPAPAAFATVTLGGRPAGTALGVADPAEGLAGLFCVATLPAARRRGVARAAVAALAAWAAEAGAPSLYLQVEAGNAAARALFTGLGFTRSHGYHYRAAPAAPVS